MGSGLILLVIVAAWLAVLVPMALRSSESADSLSSVDRFSDAMRVLARRDAAARARARAVAGPERLGEPEGYDAEHDAELEDDDLLDAYAEWDSRDTLLNRARARAHDAWAGAASLLPRRSGRSRAPLTPAGRRRRLLTSLLVLSLVTLLAALLVSPALLVVHALADLLVVLYVVQLRRLVRARAARVAAARPAARRREVAPPAAAPEPAVASEVVAEVESQVESEVEVDVAEPVAAPEPVTTVARHDEPLPVAAALGAPWSPVPVPPPVYAKAPVAPRIPRTVDLTRPGAYTEAVAAGERLPGMEDEPAATPRPAEPRRAVNDW